MGTFAVGEVVALAFPYADYRKFKVRPALVIGRAEFGNIIVCQITSKAVTSKKAISLAPNEITAGKLNVKSYIRPDKIFTVDKSLIQSKLGVLKHSKTLEVKISLQKILIK